MEMRAYLSDYVPYAQRILGDMLDFAVNTCDMDIDEYFELFTVSSVSTQFKTEAQPISPEKPNPAF